METFGLKDDQNKPFDYEGFLATFFGSQKSGNLRGSPGGSVSIIDSSNHWPTKVNVNKEVLPWFFIRLETWPKLFIFHLKIK